jgi:quercetin dioxygenase-like cupin family protein
MRLSFSLGMTQLLPALTCGPALHILLPSSSQARNRDEPKPAALVNVRKPRSESMRTGLMVVAILCMPLLAAAQDPLTVDPGHYKVLLENDHVRVLKIKYGAHEKSVLHEHPDAVAVFLTDSDAKFTSPDGTSTPASRKAGEVQFAPSGKHLPENVGDKPFEVVLVELKGKQAPAAAVSLDAVKVDPEHHEVVLENERVRVLRIKFAAHDKTKEHEHPESVAIFLTGGESKVTTADGKTRKGGGEAGGATWLARERHVVENPHAKPAEVILVELK